MVDKYEIGSATDYNLRAQISAALNETWTELQALIDAQGGIPAGGIVLDYQYTISTAGDPGTGFRADPGAVSGHL